MEPPPLTADQIRHRMHEIRRDLRVDVNEITVHASRFFDWKNYVRAFPWGSMAAAAVVGYLLVPRRLKIVAPPVETVEAAVEAVVREQQKLAPPPPPPPPAPSLWSTLLPAVGGMALRLGINYATKVGLELLDDLANSGARTTPGNPTGPVRARQNSWPEETRKS